MPQRAAAGRRSFVFIFRGLLLLLAVADGQVILQPTPRPSSLPTVRPTFRPSSVPSPNPTAPSPEPSAEPTIRPTPLPSSVPSPAPTQPTARPTPTPTVNPTAPSPAPSSFPTPRPTVRPTSKPSPSPTPKPSPNPTQPTANPSPEPSIRPSPYPTKDILPTPSPTRMPSADPTARGTKPTGQPTRQPTGQPTRQPTRQPTGQPSRRPTAQPSRQPSQSPSVYSTPQPSPYGTAFPTGHPTGMPSVYNNATTPGKRRNDPYNYTCPGHAFLVSVRVDCVPLRGPDSFAESLLRVHATSMVNFLLTYKTDAPGFNANDDEPLSQPHVSGLVIELPAYIPDDATDFSSFIVAQSSSASSYEDRLVGVALDGVPIYTALGPGGVDLVASGGVRVDACGGSFGPTPDGVRYHYRTLPSCVLSPTGMTRRGYQDRRRRYVDTMDELLDGFEGTAAMSGPVIIGWALTGHPIYSPFTPRGLLQAGLDNCNGKFDKSVMTDVNNGTQTYGFYTSPAFPYTVGCFGPGVYALQEQHSTLEAAAANLQKRAFDACPAGFVPTPDFASTGCSPCPAGKYSTASYARPGAQTGPVFGVQAGCSSVCPLGHFCPQASTKPQKCPAGRFGASKGLRDAQCSGNCSAGFFCPAGSLSSRSFVCGNETYYCPPGSGDRHHVDLGFYTVPETSTLRTPSDLSALAASASASDLDDTQREAQRQCGPGTFCLLGVRSPCPAGTYGAAPGLGSSACTAPCPAGSYCPLGSSLPTPCPAGTYGATVGLAQPSCSGLCLPGHWCPEGSTSPQQVQCKPGRYGAEAGLSTEHCSPLCEPGGAPNGTDSGGTRFCEARSCQAGFTCPAGSTSATQQPCGSPAVFCPPHSVVPTPVTVGYYSVGVASAPGQRQDEEDAATRSSQIQCESGFFCVAGVRTPCPRGLYGGTAGLSSATCSGPCAPGFTCSEASVSSSSTLCASGPHMYCPLGSYRALDVPAGFYSVNGSLTTRSAVAACSPGSYCSEGVMRSCPAGTFSTAGSKTEACDGLCSPGYYCPAGSTSPTQVICPAGRYGVAGMTNQACKGECLAGYWCPTGSTAPYQNECGGENKFCPSGSGAAQPVKSGFYSSGQNATIRVRMEQCRVSKYYSTPPAARTRQAICPDTTVP